MKEFNYKINGSLYKVVINNAGNEMVELEVNGTPYHVELEQKTKKTLSGIKRPTPSVAAAATTTTKAPSASVVNRPAPSAGKNTIQSPLPGIILDIRCKEGDTVKKGQTLMILEAMKMENNILASADGKVSQVLVHKGDSVLEGANLIVIE